jgi:hypothetical protein
MITRDDFKDEAFEEMFRNELIAQMKDAPKELEVAFKRVIAYNSIPGAFENGEFDAEISYREVSPV